MAKPCTHLDATLPGDPLRRALCGQLHVTVDTDLSKVTCKRCARRYRARNSPKAKRERGPRMLDAADLVAEVNRAPELAPSAGFPPRLTHETWMTVCRDPLRPCGVCVVCEWEHEARKWGAPDVAAWNRRHGIQRPEGAPTWPSLAAALVRLYEWLTHEKRGPSALGPILDRLRRGESGGERAAKGDDPLLRRADEIHPVREALARAYPEGGHAVMVAEHCRWVLLLRTPGVAREMPTYEELSVRLSVGQDELKRLVRSGRRSIEEDLLERGLIARRRQRRWVEVTAMRARDGEIVA